MSDFTGNSWLTAYDKAAAKILNKSAAEAEELFINDREKYDLIFKQVQFRKYIFKCRAWSDIWNDSQKVRYDVLDAELVDPVKEAENIIEKISILENKLKNSD